ncbi:acyl-CoA dehydrogenase, partial [Escherichia coli]|nr:acyl-CoA dehydrogenase [Escherichia coli]
LQRVGEMENAHAAADMATREMIAIAVGGQPGPDTTSRAMICRTLLGTAAIDTVSRAMDVAGGASFYRKAGLERAFREVQG